MRIVVDADAPANARVRTLIHECAHALGTGFEQHSRAQAEAMVDAVTYVVAAGVRQAVGGETIAFSSAHAAR